jgi:hypothetical protein
MTTLGLMEPAGSCAWNAIGSHKVISIFRIVRQTQGMTGFVGSNLGLIG